MRLISSVKVKNFDEKSDSAMNIYYSLTTSKVNNKLVYGIKVTSFVNGLIDETEYIDCITSNRAEAISLFKVCIKNVVTPISITYILDDLLSLS